MMKEMEYFSTIIFVILLAAPQGLCTTYEELKAVINERPSYGGVMGKYLNFPSLNFEPNIEADKGLVHFQRSRIGSFEKYSKRLDSVLSEYMNAQDTFDIIDCSMYNDYRPVEDINKACRFDLVELGSACIKKWSYGYEDGQPCIALHLDRILNWIPEPYTSNETVPDKVVNVWSEYAITVHCEGEDPVSKDNIGELSYYKPTGFDFKYFPYTGQTAWKNPFVFVQFENMNPAIVVRVSCSAYAKNIKHDDVLNTGKVSFEVMVD